jgi:peptidoglycan hydrolase-like protein with peptidoglycan-binding domain
VPVRLPDRPVTIRAGSGAVTSMTVLTENSHGPEVERLQTALQGQGYFCGSVDGWYGPKTMAAVAYFQSVNGLTIDAVAGPQVHEYLDLTDTRDVSVTARWPNLEVWHPGDEFVVQVDPIDGLGAAMDVRVVAWFRNPAGEDHTEEQVTVQPGSHALARLQVPQHLAEHEGEVHFTGYVFDMQGRVLTDEGTGSFRIDRPNAI